MVDTLNFCKCGICERLGNVVSVIKDPLERELKVSWNKAWLLQTVQCICSVPAPATALTSHYQQYLQICLVAVSPAVRVRKWLNGIPLLSPAPCSNKCLSFRGLCSEWERGGGGGCPTLCPCCHHLLFLLDCCPGKFIPCIKDSFKALN